MKDYIETLKKYNQEHILKYFDLVNEEKKQDIIKQIESIDFEQLKNLYNISNSNIDKAVKGVIIEHVPFVDKYKQDEDALSNMKEQGENVICSGKYAVVTMAGGQGTRLGHDGPKGTFLLNVKPRPKYLFEILAENLKRENEKYKVTIPWYIMTSTENNEKTVSFFKEHKYFGYPEDSIMFFNQGNLPLLSEDGKILIDENYNIKVASDGNGSIYKAMDREGVLLDMQKRNIKWIFIGAVDNAILNMCDPYLLGLAINQNTQIASKSVVKIDPHEKVGVFCEKDSKPSVIEYTELPEEMATETDEEGELLFGESHIMCNLYSIEALQKIAKQNLPYHSAHKKANYLNEEGKLVKTDKPNSYKYEAFIFDGFNYFDDISILRGRREEDFAPIKNKEGVDSPKTAKELYEKYWNRK